MAVQKDVLELDTDVYKQWCSIGKEKGLASHSLIATFLIQSYRDGQPDKKCIHCDKALIIICPGCDFSKNVEGQKCLEKQPVVRNVLHGTSAGVATMRSDNGAVVSNNVKEAEIPAFTQEDLAEMTRDDVFDAGSENKSPKKHEMKQIKKEHPDLSSEKDTENSPTHLEHSADSDGHSDYPSSDTMEAKRNKQTELQRQEHIKQEHSTTIEDRLSYEENMNESQDKESSSKLGFHLMAELERESEKGGPIQSLVDRGIQASEIVIGGRKEYCCIKCGQTFFQRYKMKRHFQTHLNYRPNSCPYCQASFHQLYHLQRHVTNMHTEKKPTTVEGEHEKKKEQKEVKISEEDMEILDLIVVNGDSNFSCKECGDNFCDRSKLVKHIHTHNLEGRYICKHCGKAFNRLARLKRHVARLHESIRPYVCNLCSATFLDSYHLNRHEATHTSYQPYKCSECCAAFTNTRQLKCHMTTHFADSTYTAKMEYDTAGTDMSWSKGEHIEENSPSKQSRDLQDRDNSSFACVKNKDMPHSGDGDEMELLSSHPSSSKRPDKQPQDKESASEAKKSPLIIKIPFSSIKKSAGERPFTCTTCVTSFKTLSHLKDHQLTHTGERPKKCSLCPMAYTRTNHLRKHMLKAHPETDPASRSDPMLHC